MYVTYPDRCCLVYHTHVCCLLSEILSLQYVFLMTPVADAKQCTIHEELVRHLKAILLPKQADLITKFLRQADSFFKVILKAMVQFLLNTGRIKVCSSQNVSHSFSLTGHVKVCNSQTLPPIVPPSQTMSRCVTPKLSLSIPVSHSSSLTLRSNSQLLIIVQSVLNV